MGDHGPQTKENRSGCTLALLEVKVCDEGKRKKKPLAPTLRVRPWLIIRRWGITKKIFFSILYCFCGWIFEKVWKFAPLVLIIYGLQTLSLHMCTNFALIRGGALFGRDPPIATKCSGRLIVMEPDNEKQTNTPLTKNQDFFDPPKWLAPAEIDFFFFFFFFLNQSCWNRLCLLS